MATYTLTFFTADGDISHRHTHECLSDDDIIDLAGENAHPHAIDIHEGDRYVARVPPWPPAE